MPSSTSSSSNTLRGRQIASIQRMLNLNSTKEIASSTIPEDLTWKVLVMDPKSTRILSSLLNVDDLLSCGITMHTIINSSKRAALPDVPAIYFLEPTKENILKIVNDIENDFYSEYYINFISSLDRSLLEEFANAVSLTGRSASVKQVFDQYIDFLVAEPQLFSLEFPQMYTKLNSTSVTEDEITLVADQIAQGLFNVLITLDSIPIIRAPRNGPAEFVAQKLDSKLRDHVSNLKSSNANSGTSSNSSEKKVLILLDRNIDLAAMFGHSWIYSCMVSDVFDISGNAIIDTIESESNEKNKINKKKWYIDGHDFFWKANANMPFPDAVENIEKESNEYREKAAELTSKTGVTSLSNIDHSQSDTYQIQQAIKQLPELTAKKQIIDTHMEILEALLKQLQTNNLDVFFEVEQNIKKESVQKVELDFLSKLKEDKLTSNKLDKLRTYLILYLSFDLSKSFCVEVEKNLSDLGTDMSSLVYIKRVKEILKLSNLNQVSYSDNNSSKEDSSAGSASTLNSNEKSALFANLSNKLFELTEGTKISSGFGSIVSGLKNLLPEKQNMPVTSIVESIVEPSRGSQVTLNTTDDYLFFDPYSTRGNHSKIPKRYNYQQAIVFMVGGGSYLEYENLQEWTKNLHSDTGGSSKISIVYGSDSIINARGFLEQCSLLGGGGADVVSTAAASTT